MFGLVGAHRSGKTTLAKAIAEAMGIPFFDGSFGSFARELGYDAVSDMTPAARIEMQERVLDLYLSQMQAGPRPAITDRTPIDMLAYATAEIGMHTGLSPEISERIVAYQRRCIAETARHFGALLCCRPLPIYTTEEGKPPPCPAYQRHIQLVMEGAMDQVKHGVTLAYLNTPDRETRVAAGVDLFTDYLRAADVAFSDELVH